MREKAPEEYQFSDAARELLSRQLSAASMPICAKSVKKRNPDTLAIPPSVALLAIEKALSAPRQPTDRMVAAGKEQMFVYLDEDDMVAEDGVRLIFNAMTAAA